MTEPIILAEGPETALSVYCATGYETFASLGGLRFSPELAGRPVILAVDDDPDTDEKLSRTVPKFQEAGCKVSIAWPWPERRYDKTDFNDVLVQEGHEAVRSQIVAAEPWPDSEATYSDYSVSVDEARQKTADAVSQFFAAADNYWQEFGDWDARKPEEDVITLDIEPAPPIHAMRIATGVGKTDATLRALVKYLDAS